MKLKIGNLPNSHLDAKFEDFLCTPNKYLQKRLWIQLSLRRYRTRVATIVIWNDQNIYNIQPHRTQLRTDKITNEIKLMYPIWSFNMN
jgi:hypothetical protein